MRNSMYLTRTLVLSANRHRRLCGANANAIGSVGSEVAVAVRYVRRPATEESKAGAIGVDPLAGRDSYRGSRMSCRIDETMSGERH